MRLLTTSLVAVLAAVAITACSGGSSSSSSDNTATSSATDTTSSASSDTTSTATEPSTGSDQTAAGNAATADIPSYPGATTEAAGSSMGMGAGKNAAGKVMSTSDSFDKVYAWYQKNMPSGSEKAHTTSPVQSAVFMIGEAGKDQKSVTISVQGGKTMITVASVKM
jgi:hypothetical protein